MLAPKQVSHEIKIFFENKQLLREAMNFPWRKAQVLWREKHFPKV